MGEWWYMLTHPTRGPAVRGLERLSRKGGLGDKPPQRKSGLGDKPPQTGRSLQLELRGDLIVDLVVPRSTWGPKPVLRHLSYIRTVMISTTTISNSINTELKLN